MRIRDREIKMKALKQGRLPVVTFLSELPETQHDPQSFAVDLTVFTVSCSGSAFSTEQFNYQLVPVSAPNASADRDWSVSGEEEE